MAAGPGKLTAAALVLASASVMSPHAAPVLDFGFFRARVEPIFLEKRAGHARCYVCHVDGNNAFRLERLSPGAKAWSEEQSRRNFEMASRLVNPGDPATTACSSNRWRPRAAAMSSTPAAASSRRGTTRAGKLSPTRSTGRSCKTTGGRRAELVLEPVVAACRRDRRFVACLTSANAQTTVKIGLAVPNFGAFAPVYAAEELGYYKEYGLTAEITAYRGGPAAQEALAAGAADIINFFPPGVALAVKKGIKEKIVGIGSAMPSGWAIVVMANSPFRTVADLAGKKIGITAKGATTDFYALWAAKKAGVAIETIPVGAAALIPPQIGPIDAAVLNPPLSFRLTIPGEGRSVADLDKEMEPTLPDVWVATQSLIDGNPTAVEGVLRGIYKATAYMKKNRAYGIDYLRKFTGEKDDRVVEREYEVVITDVPPRRRSSGRGSRRRLRSALAGLTDLPPIADIFTDRFGTVSGEMTQPGKFRRWVRRLQATDVCRAPPRRMGARRTARRGRHGPAAAAVAGVCHSVAFPAGSAVHRGPRAHRNEVAVAFLVAAPLAVSTGFLLGERVHLAEAFNPVVHFILAVPQSIFLPVFILAFGIGFLEKVLFGVTHAYFVILINSFAAVRSVPRPLIAAARVFGATHAQIYTRIYLPAMLPLILTGLRLGMIFCIIGVLLAEMYASRRGIGRLIFGWGAGPSDPGAARRHPAGLGPDHCRQRDHAARRAARRPLPGQSRGALMAIIEARRLAKEFGAGRAPVRALEEVSFTVEEGRFVTLVGPSGCGKSTLLQILAGFDRGDERRGAIRGRPDRPGPGKIGMVFQDAGCCLGRPRSQTSSSRSICAGTPRRCAGARPALIELVGLTSLPTIIRTSSRAACASASRLRAAWCTSRG